MRTQAPAGGKNNGWQHEATGHDGNGAESEDTRTSGRQKQRDTMGANGTRRQRSRNRGQKHQFYNVRIGPLKSKGYLRKEPYSKRSAKKQNLPKPHTRFAKPPQNLPKTYPNIVSKRLPKIKKNYSKIHSRQIQIHKIVVKNQTFLFHKKTASRFGSFKGNYSSELETDVHQEIGARPSPRLFLAF